MNVNDKNQIYSGDCTHFAADIPNVPHSSVYIWILLLYNIVYINLIIILVRI